MPKLTCLFIIAFLLCSRVAVAQPKKPAVAAKPGFDVTTVPVSKADLGTFPYFKTLPNFTATDSTTHESNRTYFYDGKNFFTIDGKVSSQNLNIKNSDQPIVSEFGCIQEFDKVIATLGGVKFFTGKMPDEALKNVCRRRCGGIGQCRQSGDSIKRLLRCDRIRNKNTRKRSMGAITTL